MKKGFRETQLRNLMEKLMVDGNIMRVGRNQYSKKDSVKELKKYEGVFMDESRILEQRMSKEFPYIKFQIWELNWFNEFLKNIISMNEYADMIELMFSKYEVDQVKMFRYARRRNKSGEITDFINNNTNIKLLVEG